MNNMAQTAVDWLFLVSATVRFGILQHTHTGNAPLHWLRVISENSDLCAVSALLWRDIKMAVVAKTIDYSRMDLVMYAGVAHEK